MTDTRRNTLVQKTTGANLSRRWRLVFEKIEAGQTYHVSLASLYGLLFGPFYYLYLRMFRKGLLIIAGMLALSTLITAIHLVVSTPEMVGLQAVIAAVFCSCHVPSDYYQFKSHGETIWPAIHRLRHPVVIAALLILPLLIGTVLTLVEAKVNSRQEVREDKTKDRWFRPP